MATAANVKVDVVEGQNDVTVTARQAIGGTPGTRYTRIESLGGNVILTAQVGDITGNVTRASGNVQLLASANIDATRIETTVGSITATATAGDITLGTAAGNQDVTLRAGSSILVDQLSASIGNATLSAVGNITSNGVSAAVGDVTLDSTGGDIYVTRIAGDGVLLYAKYAIVGNLFEVGQRLVLVSDSVDASVLHTKSSPVLKATLMGRNQPVMSNVKLTLNSPIGVSFDRLWTQNAQLNAQTGLLELVSGYVGNRMLVDNPETHLVLDNSASAVQNPFDVQLFSQTKNFYLNLNRNVLATRGADIIHRKGLTHTVWSTSTGLDSSVAETSIAEGVRSGKLVQPPKAPVIQPFSELIRFTGMPMMLPELVAPSASAPSQGEETPAQ